MDNAKQALERLINDALEQEKKLADAIAVNEKLKIENEILKERIQALEHFEPLIQSMPEEVTIELKKETAVKLYSICIDIYGGRANPYKCASDKTRQRALSLINFVANNMINYICRDKVRIQKFLKESKLTLEEKEDINENT